MPARSDWRLALLDVVLEHAGRDERVVVERQPLGNKGFLYKVSVEGRELWGGGPVGTDEPLPTATDGGSDEPEPKPWPGPNDRRVAC